MLHGNPVSQPINTNSLSDKIAAFALKLKEPYFTKHLDEIASEYFEIYASVKDIDEEEQEACKNYLIGLHTIIANLLLTYLHDKQTEIKQNAYSSQEIIKIHYDDNNYTKALGFLNQIIKLNLSEVNCLYNPFRLLKLEMEDGLSEFQFPSSLDKYKGKKDKTKSVTTKSNFFSNWLEHDNIPMKKEKTNTSESSLSDLMSWGKSLFSGIYAAPKNNENTPVVDAKAQTSVKRYGSV